MRGRNPSADSGAGPGWGRGDLVLSSEMWFAIWDGKNALNPFLPGWVISSSAICSARSSEPYNTPLTSA
jgi:hypothetical protein